MALRTSHARCLDRRYQPEPPSPCFKKKIAAAILIIRASQQAHIAIELWFMEIFFSQCAAQNDALFTSTWPPISSFLLPRLKSHVSNTEQLLSYIS